jgi:hypothetical protein
MPLCRPALKTNRTYRFLGCRDGHYAYLCLAAQGSADHLKRRARTSAERRMATAAARAQQPRAAGS